MIAMDMILDKSFKEEEGNALRIVRRTEFKQNKMLEKGYLNGVEYGITGSKVLMILPDYIYCYSFCLILALQEGTLNCMARCRTCPCTCSYNGYLIILSDQQPPFPGKSNAIFPKMLPFRFIWFIDTSLLNRQCLLYDPPS